MKNKILSLLAVVLIVLSIAALALWFGPLDNCRVTSPAGREFVVACKNAPAGWEIEALD